MSSPLPPRRWILELTQACTLSCPSCNLGPDGGWNNEPEHPGQDWCTLLTAGVLRGLTHVSLLGGEPLLYPDLDQIIRHGQGKGLNMALVSNGLLLNPERVLNLQQHGLKGLVISLDHADSRHDALRGAPGLFQHIDGLLSALVSHRRKGRLRLKRISVNTLWHTTPERTELQAWMDWLRRRDVRRAHWFTPAALTPALRRETLQNCPDLAPGSHPFDHPQERAPVTAMSEDDWALVQTFCRRTGIHIEIEDQLPFPSRLGMPRRRPGPALVPLGASKPLPTPETTAPAQAGIPSA